MMLYVYSIFDTAADAYIRPVFYPNEEVMIRSLRQLLMQPDDVVATFPEQFQVYSLGTFDDATGVLDVHPPKWLLNVNSLVKTIEE